MNKYKVKYAVRQQMYCNQISAKNVMHARMMQRVKASNKHSCKVSEVMIYNVEEV